METEENFFRKQAEQKVKNEKARAGTHIIGEEKMFATITDLYNEKLKIKDTLHQEEIDKLKSKIDKLNNDLRRFKPRELDVDFTKDWHKHIKLVHFEFFTIECLWDKYACPYCNAFESNGFLDEFRNINQTINLPPKKFHFSVFRCDYADRFLSHKDYDAYSLKMSKKGELYFYARGIGVNKFPAFDMWVYFKKGKVNMANNFDFIRKLGLGMVKKFDNEGDPFMEIQFGDFTKSVINYFKDFNIESLDMKQHKNNYQDNDPFVDKVRKKRFS